jgi:3'(2'), 5'-bisphosphate nucleotidase
VKAAELLERAQCARMLAARAAAIVRDMQAGIEAREKSDGSGPVTEADLAAERCILKELRARYPDDLIVSEETAATAADGGAVWCVDPLDGTREYSQGRSDYAVMVGLLVDGEPAAGALALPAEDRVVWGAVGHGVFIDDAPVDVATLTQMSDAVLVHSRSHRSPSLAEVLRRLRPKSTISAGSAGYKAAQLVTGAAHVYIHPRGGTMWWDSVAPAAVVLAAGGFFADALGKPIRYVGSLEHESGLLFAVPGLETEVRTRLADSGAP